MGIDMKAGVKRLESRTYIIGREGHIYINDPTVSKQHAEIQIINGEVYLRDLDSTNGTFLNGERIEAQRYIELREQDALKFGESSREYVLLHDKSED